MKRKYRNISPDRMVKAVDAVKSGTSLRKASKKYSLNRQTLANKIKGLPSGPVGRPLAISIEDEVYMAARIVLLCDWGFPLTPIDFKILIQDCSNRRKVVHPRFKNNVPGDRWIRNFIKRHKLANRTVTNISRKRANVDRAAINDFFDNVSVHLENIDPDNVVNYDETALVADPGKRKCLVKREMKYHEAVSNHAKSGTSVMFAGTAGWKLLPPYVEYRALNLYKQWTHGGPTGSFYTFTRSGWFDERCVEDWFRKAAPTYLKIRPGHLGQKF